MPYKSLIQELIENPESRQFFYENIDGLNEIIPTIGQGLEISPKGIGRIKQFLKLFAKPFLNSTPKTHIHGRLY